MLRKIRSRRNERWMSSCKIGRCSHSFGFFSIRTALIAENLFLRKQLALFKERKAKSHPACPWPESLDRIAIFPNSRQVTHRDLGRWRPRRPSLVLRSSSRYEQALCGWGRVCRESRIAVHNKRSRSGIEACRVRYWDLPKEARIAAGVRPAVPDVGYSRDHVIGLASELLAKASRGNYPFILDSVRAIVVFGEIRQFTSATEVLAALEGMIVDLEARLAVCEATLK